MVTELQNKGRERGWLRKKTGNKHFAAKKKGEMAGNRDGAAENGNQRGTVAVQGTETETVGRYKETRGIGKAPSGTVEARQRNARNGDSTIRNGDSERKKREESGGEWQ